MDIHYKSDFQTSLKNGKSDLTVRISDGTFGSLEKSTAYPIRSN